MYPVCTFEQPNKPFERAGMKRSGQAKIFRAGRSAPGR